MSGIHKSVGTVPNMPKNWHCGFIGQSGRGKTTAMLAYLRQKDIDDGSAILCYDPDYAFEQFLRAMGYETVVFEPRDPEVIPKLISTTRHPDDIDVMAEALVSGTSREDNDFAPGAKTVISGVLRMLYADFGENVANNMIYDFFDFATDEDNEDDNGIDEIYNSLMDSGYGRYAFPIRDSEAGQSPHMSTVTSAIDKGLRAELGQNPGNFDISEWVRNPGGTAFIIRPGIDSIAGCGPSLRLIIDLAMQEAMRCDDASCHFLADEVDTLPGSSVVPNVAARGRSNDCYAVIGVQTVKQMEDNFGEGNSEQILSNLGNYLMFNPGSDENTRDMLKRLVGEKRRTEVTSSQSRSASGMLDKDRQTAGTSEQIKERCPITDYEISRMGKGDCVVVEFDGGWWFGNLSLPDWATEQWDDI